MRSKKKIDAELTTYFPELFDDVNTKEYYDVMKQRTQAVLEGIIKGESKERDKAIDNMTDRMVLFAKPKNFTGRTSIEIQHDKDFESMCLTISKETHADAKRMTVLEYYNAYEYIRRMAKERQKLCSKRVA